MEYYIYVTNDCNLNCSYCSVLLNLEKYKIPKEPIYDVKQIEIFISGYQESSGNNVADIYFFGGEPTMDYNFIEEIIDVMEEKQHDYNVNFILHTNAILLSKANEKILEKLYLTIVSINYEKIYTNGILNDYFYEIMKSVSILKQKNILSIARLTVSPKTSLYSVCSLIGNFFDYVYWQLDNSEDIGSFSLYKYRYCSEITLLFEYWMSFLEKGLFLSYVPFMSAIKNFIIETDKPSEFYCGYGTSMIYIQTDGSCYACCDNVGTKSHYIGNIFIGIKFPEINLEKTICNECEFIKVCGGRCGRMHKDFNLKKIKEYCELNKFTFNLIKNNLTKIKILLEKYPVLEEKICDEMAQYTEYTS